MKDIDKLIHDHKRLIESEAFKHAQFVPLIVAQAEAYKLAREAAIAFDEKQGLKFSTYLTTYLKKLSRLSTQYGGVIRIPENKQFKINKLNHVESSLTSDLGRPPSVAELADATGWGIPAVANLLSSRKKEVNVSNLAFTPVFSENGDKDDWTHFVYHDLSDMDKLVFEYKTGFGGKPILNNKDIAKKLNLSETSVAHRSKIITDKLKERI